MSAPERILRLPPRERRGSRVRCLLLTDGSRPEVAKRLSELARPWGFVDAEHHVWLPRGFDDPAEAKLGKTAGLLSPEHRRLLTDWWLAVPEGANTPNWDIASTATIDGREGLLLVEAKAHSAEIKSEGKRLGGNVRNDEQIRNALAMASSALNRVQCGWALSADSHYQLANRFAWAWKIASLGVPVILVYLGFLYAAEMCDQGAPLEEATAWEQLVKGHAHGVVPESAWSQTISIGSTALRGVIRSIHFDIPDERDT